MAVTIVVLILFAVVALSLWLGIVRNQQVYNYRRSLIGQISAAAKYQITLGDYDWAWRYEVLDAIPYDQMVFQFWRPLRSFYPDMFFTKLAATSPSLTLGGSADG